MINRKLEAMLAEVGDWLDRCNAVHSCRGGMALFFSPPQSFCSWWTARRLLRRAGLEKLTPEEKEALGLGEVQP